MNVLVVLNDPPYGTERSYNGGQQVPKGYYNIEMMLRAVRRRDGVIGVCGSCMDARGITDGELVDGCHRSSLDELTDWIPWAERVLTF